MDNETHISQGQKTQLTRAQVGSFLEELILYARARLRDRHIEAKEKSTWARVLRESITEWNRLHEGEEPGEAEEFWKLLGGEEKRGLKFLKKFRKIYRRFKRELDPGGEFHGS